jgi:hypothetical protein
MKRFAEKFGDQATKLYDLTIREDRYFVSEILALESLVSKLDDIPLFPNQLILLNLATLDVSPPKNPITPHPPSKKSCLTLSRESIIPTAPGPPNTTPPSTS